MRWIRRIGAFLHRRHLQSEIDAELAYHRELANSKEGGVPLGNSSLIREQMLDVWRLPILEDVLRDGIFAMRNFRRSPAFTITAVLSLALGFGMTTALFTVLNAVALRPLSYRNADRLVWITQIIKANSTDEITLTPDYLDWRDGNRSFAGMAAFNIQTRAMTGAGDPIEINAAKASASLLEMLGARPALGRLLTREEDFAGHEFSIVLSDQLWRSRFHAARDVLDRFVLLDGQHYRVVGVLPAGFLFPDPEHVDAVTPLGKNEMGERARDGRNLTVVHNVIGQLKLGLSMKQATEDLSAIQAHLPLPPFRPTITIKILGLREHLFGNARTAGITLVCGSALVLLIAGANLGSLFLVRLLGRDRELAMRRMLGATRRRLMAQLVIESSLLIALAAILGLAFALADRAALLSFGPYRPDIYESLPLDKTVWVFAACLLVLSSILFGVLPALRISKVEWTTVTEGGNVSVAAGKQNLRLITAITVAQIAVVLALSHSAATLMKSFWNMRYQELGFESSRTVALVLNLDPNRYREAHRRLDLVRESLTQLAAIPGVESVAVTAASEIPPGVGHADGNVRIEGQNLAIDSRQKASTRRQQVSGAFFPILQIPLLSGRLLDGDDTAGSTPVVVVNSQFATQYLRGQGSLGRRLRLDPDGPWFTIVGVVGNTKTSGLAARPEPVVYTPYQQTNAERLMRMGLLVKSPLPLASVASQMRKVISRLDPEQPIASLQSIDQKLNDSVLRPRFTANILSAFAAGGLLLATIGVYGVIAHRVRRTSRELAVRHALGATPAEVVAYVLRGSLQLLLPGLALGLAAALAGGRIISSQLFNIKGDDPQLLTLSCLSVAAAALFASLVPALRASRLDPMRVLRQL